MRARDRDYESEIKREWKQMVGGFAISGGAGKWSMRSLGKTTVSLSRLASSNASIFLRITNRSSSSFLIFVFSA